MGRAPCCDKANVKRGPWSPEEDEALRNYIQKHGTGGNWISLPTRAGLKRCGKSCRLRWLNYLRPDIKHGGFTDEEDDIICKLFCSLGSRWSFIASKLPRRTDNDIKNYWNTKLKKKFMAQLHFLDFPNATNPKLESREPYNGWSNHQSSPTFEPNQVPLPSDVVKFSELSSFPTASSLPIDQTNCAPACSSTLQNVGVDSAYDMLNYFGFSDNNVISSPFFTNLPLTS